MKLKVLGSSSSGNCYILENDVEALIIEAGLPFKEVKKALNFNIRKIVGVVVSHCHSDHSKAAIEYKKAGISVFKPYEFPDISADTMHDAQYGNFKIRAFPNRAKDGHWFHNNNDGTGCPCYGFHIYHPDMGNMIYVSDTECVRWVFSNIQHVLVEANHSKECVDKDSAKYTHQITGHMEIGTTCEFLKANNNAGLRNVVLLHLSSDSSDAEDFKARAEKAVDCAVYVAERGLEVDLNLAPF